ncbi:MAG: hypothetical protein U1E36_05155 [Rickettsiales bacterium]
MHSLVLKDYLSGKRNAEETMKLLELDDYVDLLRLVENECDLEENFTAAEKQAEEFAKFLKPVSSGDA